MQTGMRRGLHLHANLYLLLILRNDIVYATVCINICIRLCLYNCSCLCRNLRVVLTRRHLCMHHQTSAYAIDWSMKSTTTLNSLAAMFRVRVSDVGQFLCYTNAWRHASSNDVVVVVAMQQIGTVGNRCNDGGWGPCNSSTATDCSAHQSNKHSDGSQSRPTVSQHVVITRTALQRACRT